MPINGEALLSPAYILKWSQQFSVAKEVKVTVTKSVEFVGHIVVVPFAAVM